MQDYCVEHGKMRAGFEISFTSVSAPPPVEEKKGPLGKVVTVLQAKYKSKTTVEVQVEVEGVEGTSWHARSKLSNKHNKKMLEDYLALKPLEAYVAPSTSKPALQMDPQYAAPSPATAAAAAAAAPPPATAPPADAAPPAPLPPPAPAFSVPVTAVLPVPAFSVPAPAGFEYIGCDVCRRWRIVSTSDIESNQVLITTLT
jgi:hypothetical protein